MVVLSEARYCDQPSCGQPLRNKYTYSEAFPDRPASTFTIHKHPSIALSQRSLIVQQEKLITYRTTHKQVTIEDSWDL